jgi:outer membrane protein
MTMTTFDLSLVAWLIGAGLVAAPARAEQLSRGAAIQRALEQNPQVAAARAGEAQAEARRAQARSARLPTVSVTVALGPSLKAELVPGSAVQSTENAYGDVGLGDLSVVLGGELSVLQPLYTFGKIDERERAASHEIRARRAQTEMTRATLAVKVAELYEGLLLAHDVERFLLETEHWLLRSIEDTEAGIAKNTGATEQDLARLRAALTAAELGLNQARAGKRQAAAGLAAYLGLRSAADVQPKETGLELLPALALDEAQLVALAQSERPELAALTEGGRAFAALARAEAAGNWPDFFALAFARGAYTPGRDLVQTRYVQDPLNGFYPGMLLGARWQMTGGMASERAAEQRARGLELERQLSWARVGVGAEVSKALEDVLRAQKDSEQVDGSLGSTKQWLVRASADYSIGLGDSRELTDAAAAYVQLRMVSFESRYRHNVARADLAHATGTLNESAKGLYPTRGDEP